MATVQLESLSLIRSSALHSVTSSPPITSSSFSARRSSLTLPRYAGIRLRPAADIRFPSRTGSRTAPRTGRIACEARDAAVEVAPITEANWQSLVLESESPVLVEFWAPWCGPCRIIQPLIDTLAKEYAGKLKCYKLNTDESPSIASQFGIRSIPTVLIFKNGEKKDAVIGAVPKETLTSSIEKFL